MSKKQNQDWQSNDQPELYSELDEEVAVAEQQRAALLQAAENKNQNKNEDEETKAIKRKLFWFSPFFLFVLVFFGTFLALCLSDHSVVDQPVISTPKVIETVKKVSAHTIVQQEVFYSRCGHTLEEKFQDSPLYRDKTYEELEAAGWTVAEVDTQKIRVYKNETGFCPADAAKRTIRRTAEGLGIYEGPKTADGDLLFEMQIDFSQLPEEWQATLSSPAPDNALEFASEEELTGVLENLDELVVDSEFDGTQEYEYWNRGVV